MAWNDIFVAVGGVAGIAAALTLFARLVAEKSADAALKRFEHSLKLAEQDHAASLKRSEAEFNATLARAAKEHDLSLKRLEESHKASVTFASAVDVELRTQRTRAYAALWSRTGALPQWPRNDDIQYDDLQTLSEDLRDWYFQTGGIYLSTSARGVYGSVQEAIHAVLSGRSTGHVADADYEAIRKACSSLRTELTEDLLSRRESPVLQDAGPSAK